MSNFWKNERKSKHTAFRKGSQRLPHRRFNAQSCLDGHSEINNWEFLIFEQRETNEQLKERECIWQRTKNFLSDRVKPKGGVLILTEEHSLS